MRMLITMFLCALCCLSTCTLPGLNTTQMTAGVKEQHQPKKKSDLQALTLLGWVWMFADVR